MTLPAKYEVNPINCLSETRDDYYTKQRLGNVRNLAEDDQKYLLGMWNPNPDSKVHGANIGPTWVPSAPDGPHVRHMNFVMRVKGQLNSRSR